MPIPFPSAALLRGARTIARQERITVAIVSDRELLAEWRAAVPHREHVHQPRPPDGVRIIAVGRRDERGQRAIWLLRATLRSSRSRSVYAFSMITLLLAAAKPGCALQVAALDELGQPPRLVEQLPRPRLLTAHSQ